MIQELVKSSIKGEFCPLCGGVLECHCEMVEEVAIHKYCSCCDFESHNIEVN